MSGRVIVTVSAIVAVAAILGITYASSASSLTVDQIGLRNQIQTSGESSWYFEIYDETTGDKVHSEIIDIDAGQGTRDGGATVLDSSRTYTVEIQYYSGKPAPIIGASCDGSSTGTWDDDKKITGISAPGAETFTCTFVT